MSQATDRAYVEGYAAAHGLRVDWQGEIGFSRECVGLLDPARDSYVAYDYASGAGQADVPDAYHKDTYLAVLGRGPAADAQLAVWVRHLAAIGARFEYRLKQAPDLSTLVYGHVDELTVTTGSVV